MFETWQYFLDSFWLFLKGCSEWDPVVDDLVWEWEECLSVLLHDYGIAAVLFSRR